MKAFFPDQCSILERKAPNGIAALHALQGGQNTQEIMVSHSIWHTKTQEIWISGELVESHGMSDQLDYLLQYLLRISGYLSRHGSMAFSY